MESIAEVVLGLSISVISIVLVVSAINYYQMMIQSFKMMDNNEYSLGLRKHEEL